MAAKKGSMGDKIAKGYKGGKSGPELAKQFRVAIATIYYHLRQLKVKRRPKSVAQKLRYQKAA